MKYYNKDICDPFVFIRKIISKNKFFFHGMSLFETLATHVP